MRTTRDIIRGLDLDRLDPELALSSLVDQLWDSLTSNRFMFEQRIWDSYAAANYRLLEHYAREYGEPTTPEARKAAQEYAKARLRPGERWELDRDILEKAFEDVVSDLAYSYFNTTRYS